MKKISLIIPVYNTEEYLEKCLESAISQTYENIEIICIDDGSTDSSGQILNDYAEKDSRILAIHHENSGESAARNAGLKIARGDYIAFMDCDDWIEPDMYALLASAIEQKDVDLVASGWIKELPGNSQRIYNKYKVSDEVFGQKELMKYVYKRDAYQGFAYMWNKLYRRRILTEADGSIMLFDERLKLGGDVLYLAKILLNTHRALYIDQSFYHYRQRKDSGCHTDNLDKLRDWLRAYEIAIDLYIEKKIDDDVLVWMKRFLAYHSSNFAELSYRQGEDRMLLHCQGIMYQYEKEYWETNRQYPDRIYRYKKILKYEV